MAQEERLQENSDPGKLCTAEGIGRRQKDDPQCRSGTAQRELRPGAMLKKKAGKDERRRIDAGKARNAKRE
jgi:hypothetical protein